MLQRVREQLGWVGLGLVVAGVAARAWAPVREVVGWGIVWAGLLVLGAFVALEWRRLVSRLADWWTRGRTFLTQVRNELERVTWPSRAEVSATTFVVIVTSIFFGIYLWVIDLSLTQLVQWIFRMLGRA